MCHVKVCTCLRWCYSMCLYTCVIHSLLLVMPVYMLQCIAVLLGVMIYAGGKNNVIPHTTGLTSPLLFCSSSRIFNTYPLHLSIYSVWWDPSVVTLPLLFWSSSCMFAPFIIPCAMIPYTTGLTSPLPCVRLLTYLILIHYICPFSVWWDPNAVKILVLLALSSS